MRVLITGACGFVGSELARGLLDWFPGCQITGVDNMLRPGGHINRHSLARLGIRVIHGDIRSWSDMEGLPSVDWVVDAAANPAVMAGVDGKTSSRQLVEHNLCGTVNILELCRERGAGFILLSTSRVYSIPPLAGLPLAVSGEAFAPRMDVDLPCGASSRGISESFSTAPPVSLYGVTKLASEQLALEYGESFGFPVWVNRCGVMGGAGQFGKADQGIFSYWIHAWKSGKQLSYIGFDGLGHQVRDVFHPLDLVPVLKRQMDAPTGLPSVANFGGGIGNAMSLAQLSGWCRDRFGGGTVVGDPASRPFDIPWLVMDTAMAEEAWGWSVRKNVSALLSEIAEHAEQNPEWLEMSSL